MLKAMIVDDMDITRREIKRLKLWNGEVGFVIAEEAKNGLEALGKLEACSIDLVITDIKMPKIDGLELLRKIMEKNLCPCVVLFSDHTEFSYARQGLVLGAFDYLTKPADEKEFYMLLLRAKDYILDKKKSMERVRVLEEKLGEKVEVFISEADKQQVIQLIQAGDRKVLEVASRMVDVLNINLNHDLIKVESVLKNFMREMLDAVVEGYPWFEKFVNINELVNVDFSRCDSIESIKVKITCAIERILAILKKLNFDTQDQGIAGQVCKYILEHVDSSISLKAVADALYMNKTYISEAFKQKTGVSFVEYLTVVKMERAKKLLNEERFKIYEVGEKLGFKDVEYFSKLFKRHTGISPTEFRHNYIIKG